MNEQGEEEQIQLDMTEGTNPKEEIISTNSKANGDSNLQKEQALVMFKFRGRPNQGLSIRIGEMGIPEVDYWRRDAEDQYHNIPINLKNTNQKNVDTEAQRHIDSTKTTQSHLKEDNKRIKQKMEEENDEIPFKEIHSEKEESIRELGSLEVALRKAAKECKVSYEAFLIEYNRADGNNEKEKIEQAKEEICEQFERNAKIR